jgi:NAD(P)-dependent dehydrogenase (short-subunit alcohol dehydrogenase family)
MKEFKHKVAVITGAGSGIGRAIAERFAREGMKIVLADVEELPLSKAERELRDKGTDVIGVLTDVSNAEDVERLARKSINTFGAVHILCNNAGVFGDFAPLWRQSLKDWEWVLGVNLWGVIHGIKAFVPIMLDQGEEGHLVNTASLAGLFSMPLVSLYHVTKGAIISLSESLHHELLLQKAKLKVSVLCPGMVKTKFMESERNRPAHLGANDKTRTEIEEVWSDAYSEFISHGMRPEEVADHTINAIRQEKFYVFPNPQPLEIVRLRMEAILEQSNPKLHLTDAMKKRLLM